MSLPADETQALPLLHRAMDLGINFFDTADIYQHGKNEELVGKAIKDRRNKIILASKVGNVNRADGNGLDWNPSKEHILSGIEESLKRLNTDYIDLYQLHGGTIQDNIDETIEAFELLKQQGKIRHYGISSIRPNVIREYIKRSSIVSVMMQYSLLDRRPEEECLDLIHKNRTGVLSRGSVAQGLLIGKPPKPYLDRDEQQVKKAADAVKTISGNKRTPTQTAIRYVLQHAAVSSAVVGTRTMQQLEDVAATITSPELTNEEIIFLKNSIAANKYKDHR
jgi:aryl-alcohol dehydrogenase-like predicted oxidoreductase